MEDKAEDKMGSNSCFCGAYTIVGEDSKKQINYIKMEIQVREKNQVQGLKKQVRITGYFTVIIINWIKVW